MLGPEPLLPRRPSDLAEAQQGHVLPPLNQDRIREGWTPRPRAVLPWWGRRGGWEQGPEVSPRLSLLIT